MSEQQSPYMYEREDVNPPDEESPFIDDYEDEVEDFSQLVKVYRLDSDDNVQHLIKEIKGYDDEIKRVKENSKAIIERLEKKKESTLKWYKDELLHFMKEHTKEKGEKTYRSVYGNIKLTEPIEPKIVYYDTNAALEYAKIHYPKCVVPIPAVPPSERIDVLAFNKRIKPLLKGYVEASTGEVIDAVEIPGIKIEVKPPTVVIV